MSPVFLIVSGKLEDTNELLTEIKEWLAEFLGPLVYELRDSVNQLGGMTPDGSYPYLDSLVRIEAYLLFFVVCVLCWGAYKLFKLFF